jgi:predicted acylesterase/phospholipase RssA
MKTKFRTKIEFTKTGLVCSGGATKAAAFHIGVCLALRDKGFSFVGGKAEIPTPANALPYPKPLYHPNQIATYVGSSAGALICTMLAAGVGIESLINSFAEKSSFRIPGSFKELPRIQYSDMLNVNWPRPMSILRSFKKTPLIGKTLESLLLRNLRVPGLFSTRGLAQYLKNNVLPTEKFYELKPDLFVIGTQLDHSRKIVFGRFGTEKTFNEYCQYASNANISDAVAASMSLPIIYAPYKVQHGEEKSRYYIDGEIRETLSTHVAKENQCDLLICSYTHQPYHYKEEIGSLNQYGIPAIVIQSLYQSIEQKVYSAKRAHQNKKIALNTVREFFKENKYPEEELNVLCKLLGERMDFNESLNYIFIHPESKDREMFFGDHFTLNRDTLQEVVTIGYRRAMSELRKYDLVPKII